MRRQALSRFGNHAEVYSALKERAERMRSRLEGSFSASEAEMKCEVSQSGIDSILVPLLELEERLEQTADDWKDKTERMKRAIEALPDERAVKVLWLRDIEGLGWNDVAREANYSRRQCERIYKAAINKLYEGIDEG